MDLKTACVETEEKRTETSQRLVAMKSMFLVGAMFGLALYVHAAGSKTEAIWLDADTAAREVPHFELIGEYLSKDGHRAVQANLIPGDRFLVASYQGGLPGAGWDRTPIVSRVMAPDDLKELLRDFKKTVRVSPTMGKPAPADAIVRFPVDFTNIKDGLMWAGAQTRKDLKSFKMHIEFLVPLKPGRTPSSQARGNSGIYIFNNYEVQVLDSFALDLDETNNAVAPESKSSQWCGALYKTKVPAVNMAFPPLTWQTYDIVFHAPVFEGKIKKRNARITVLHNGVMIHDDVELANGTGAGAKHEQVAKGPVIFQGHGNPVAYRNVWATALRD